MAVMSVKVKEEVCMGCGLCRVNCQIAHSASQDAIKAFKKQASPPPARIRIDRREEICFPVQCRHCDEPACVYACLTGALSRDPETGTVLVDEKKCIGCWTCIVACPEGALTRDRYNHHVVKCDLCPGLTVPVCVANCPNEALVISYNGHKGDEIR